MRPRPGERCSALDPNGKWCGRKAIRIEQYHGDGEIYGYFNEPWPSWVRAALCDKHSERRARSTEGTEG